MLPLSMLEAAVGCGARMAERHARFGKPLLFPPRPERFPLSPQRGEGLPGSTWGTLCRAGTRPGAWVVPTSGGRFSLSPS